AARPRSVTVRAANTACADFPMAASWTSGGIFARCRERARVRTNPPSARVRGRELIKSRLVTGTRSMSALAHFADSSRTCTLRSGELLAATKEAFRVPQNLRANERIGICAHHNGPRLPTWGPTDNISFRRIARHDCYARRRVWVSLPDIRALPVRFPSIGR